MPFLSGPFKKIWLGAFAGILMSTFTVVAAEYSPNFKGTDINEFINVVGKNLKKTIIVDPNVRGKINVRSYDLLNEDQYFQFFLNVLDVYGFAVVEMPNNVLKVVRNKDAKTSAIPVVGDNTTAIGDEMVTRVLQVKNVSVRELAPIMRQLSDQAGGGNVVSYDPSNVMMLTGRAAVVNRLVDIITRIDKSGDQEVEIVRMEYASAPEIVRIVESLNKPTSGKSDTPQFLIPKVVADERTNSVIISGEPKARARVSNLVRRLDSELESNGNTRVRYLKYARAEELVSVLQGVSASIVAEESQAAGKSKKGKDGNVSIEHHEDTNSLVITAQPDMMRSLLSVVDQLDVRRLQVLVEAIIVEVFEGDGAGFGVQWISEDAGMIQFPSSGVGIGELVAGSRSARGEEGTTTVKVNPDGSETTTTTGDTEGDYSLIAQLLGGVNGTLFGIIDDNWAMLVQAVRSSTNSNILATPSLTTMDNQEAYFIVGQDIPTITGSTAGSNNDNPFQTVERTEVGVKLKVTPQVNEGTAVQLVIEQEVSSLSGATEVDVTINKREIKTTVLVEDGQTVILGGLIDEDVQESVSKVPLLGDIPFIGNLFKSTNTSKRKRNLMVFIKPTIIRDDKLLNQISGRKYNAIRAMQLDKQAQGIKLMEEEKTQPALPEWDEELILPPNFEEYIDGKDDVDVPPEGNE